MEREEIFRDKSGTINQSELQEALTTFGYNLSPQVQMKYHFPPAQEIAKPQSYLLKVTPNVLKAPQVYRLLLRKFDRTGRQAVCFDDFIQCCLVMQVIGYLLGQRPAYYDKASVFKSLVDLNVQTNFITSSS